MGYQPKVCACGRSGPLWRWHRVNGKLVCEKCYERIPSHLHQAVKWLFAKWGEKVKPRHEHLEEYHAKLVESGEKVVNPYRKAPKSQVASPSMRKPARK